jgi:hypothetical protein
MPYVRHRTLIQMAPRNMLGRHQRGMGEANCPSLEQLQGISDSSDPCQNPIAALPIALATQLPVMSIPQQTPAPVVGSDQWIQQNSGWLIGAGVALFVVAMVTKR